jgi:hypothetical protein
MKRCTRCGIEKALADFYRRKDSEDGHRNTCKACKDRQNAKYASEHADRVRQCKAQWAREHPLDVEQKSRKAETWQVYYRENHEHLLALARSEKYKPYRRSYRQREYARARHRERMAAVQVTEAWRAYKRGWRHSHPELERSSQQRRRALIEANGGTCTLEQWRTLCEMAGHKCLACESDLPVTCDHIVPVALGGNGDLANLQPLCLSCNSSKRTKIMDYRPEWMRAWVQSQDG